MGPQPSGARMGRAIRPPQWGGRLHERFCAAKWQAQACQAAGDCPWGHSRAARGWGGQSARPSGAGDCTSGFAQQNGKRELAKRQGRFCPPEQTAAWRASGPPVRRANPLVRLQAARGLHSTLPIFAALQCGPTRRTPQPVLFESPMHPIFILVQRKSQPPWGLASLVHHRGLEPRTH